jgi:predicted dehydrogenase
MVNLGFLGTGSIVRSRHLPETLANPNCSAAAFYNRTTKRAAALAQTCGGRVYTSVDALMKDDDIDAVVVATANSLHASYTIKALEAGKHVLCEKPMAVTVQECQNMIDAAAHSQKKLMIAHNMRLEAAHLLAKDILTSGKLGSVLSFQTTIGHEGPEEMSIQGGTDSWFFNKNDAVFGALGDLGVHKIDLIRWLLDDNIVDISACVTTRHKRSPSGNFVSVDDYAACILHTKKGIVGTMTAAWIFYGEPDYSSIFQCTEGTLKIYTDPESPVIVNKRNGDKIYYQPQDKKIGDRRNSGIIDMFVDCIENETKPFITGKDGLESIRTILACSNGV